MGGCNSTLNDIELGAFAVGAGVATVGSGGAAAVGALAAAGAAGTYFATKQGCSRSPKVLVDATNEIIATAIIQSLTLCTQLSETSQNIEITCKPNLPEGTVYEQNLACGNCVENVFQGMLDQHAMERKQWVGETPSQVGVRLDINTEYILMMGRVGTCGMVACKACTMANVSQSNILTQNSACYDTMTDTESFKSNLQSLLNQQLVNNQDVLAGVAKALGKDNVSDISETITNTISSKVTSTFLNQFVQSLKSSQTIILNADGVTSFSNIAQINTFQAAVSFVTNSNIVSETISSEVFDTISQIANQQNTLNEVGTLTFQATVGFTQMIYSVVGQVMLATLVLLAVVVLVIIGYAGYKSIRKSILAAEKVSKDVELAQFQAAAFERF